MAETIDRLQVEITAQTENFTKQMDVVNAKLDALQGVVASSGGGMSGLTAAMTKAGLAVKVISTVVGKAVSGFTNLTKTIAQNGSEYARIKVATETVTRNLGMTTEQVNSLRNSLAESNTYGTKAEEIIKTLAMSGLVDMANGLKVVKAGTDDTIEGVGALVYTMKDLAAAAGIESAEGIDRITKFIRRGEATFADGVIEIGNLAYEYNQYAASLGKTASALTAEERAQVRLNIVMREGQKAYGTYANTMQSSGKAWDSAKASIRTMTEIIGEYLEPALSVLANGFFQLTSGLRSGLMDAGGVIKSWASKVAAYLVVAIQTIGRLLSKIPLIGKYFQGMASFTVKPLSNISNSAENLSDSIDGVTDSTNGAVKAMNKLAAFDEMNILDQEDGGGSGMASMVGGFGDVNFEESTSKLQDFSDEVMSKVGEIQAKWDEFKGRIAKVFEPLAIVWNTLVTPALDNFRKSFDNLLTKINSPIMQTFGDVLKMIAGILAGAIVVAISGVINLATVIINVISTTIDYWDRLAKLVGVGISNIIVWTTNLYNKLVYFINNWKTILSNAVTSVWDKIKNTFSNIGSWFSDKFNNAVNGIKNAFSNIPAFFGDIWNKIKSKFSEIGSSAGEVVGGAFKTVINGVLSRVQSVINTPINAINSLISKINEVPGISLSRLGTISMPRLASGGIVDNPTVALLGESGREAVVPLENTDWVDKLAEKINGTGGNQEITIKIGEETVYSGFVDYINDKALRTGTKLLNI